MAEDRKNVYRNAEGYSDPTIGKALDTIAREERQKEFAKLAVISDLVTVLKKTAELAGFEVIGRIVLQDKETGKKYK